MLCPTTALAFTFCLSSVHGSVEMHLTVSAGVPTDTSSKGQLELRCAQYSTDGESIQSMELLDATDSETKGKKIGTVAKDNAAIKFHPGGYRYVSVTGEIDQYRSYLEASVSPPTDLEQRTFMCLSYYMDVREKVHMKRDIVTAQVPHGNVFERLYNDLNRERIPVENLLLDMEGKVASLRTMRSHIEGLGCGPITREKNIMDICEEVTSEFPGTSVLQRSDGVDVVCDGNTDGGRWTVIQRRVFGNVSFQQDWATYRRGFGDVTGDFWFGLDNIHNLTSHSRHELRIDMTFQDTTYYASYEFFEVLDVSTHYQLLVGGYTGTAGDGLWYHNKMPFSTEDHDNDHCDCNCAEAYTGAWWYKKCHRSNLNGNWSSPVRGQGVHWFLLTSNNDTLSYVDMKTRRWKQSSTTLI